MRSTGFIATLGLLCAAAAGCGSDPLNGGNPKLLVGVYDVMIESGGKSDQDVMNVDVGSNSNLLLNFVLGISQVRCAVTGPMTVSIISQTIRVEHSTGVAEGMASGKGTITPSGTCDLTLNVKTAGLVQAFGDASSTDVDGGSAVAGTQSFHITGMRQK